jgi:hypothetical protein
LEMAEIVGVGRVKLHLPSLAKGATIKQLEVMLFGEDGSAYTVRTDQAAELPLGRYATGGLTVSLLDGKKPEPWNFVFSRSEEPKRWLEVRRDEEILLDPVGALRFNLNLKDDGKPARPGQSLYITPRLYTADGLLINSSSCGDFDRFAGEDKHNCARIQLVRPDKTVLSAAQSGFA